MCLDHLGAISVSDDTRRILLSAAADDGSPQDKIANTLRLTAATHEFQRPSASDNPSRAPAFDRKG